MRLVEKAHEHLAQVVKPGDLCVDLTAGNGWDSLFLANMVGEKGLVYIFDIQGAALLNTSERLENEAKFSNFRLIQECHSKFDLHLPREHQGHISAIIMNLGYLPGSDKKVITRHKTTIIALEKSYQWLQKGGCLSIMAYQTHRGASEEVEAIKNWFSKTFDAKKKFYKGINPTTSPILFWICKS